MTPSSVPHFRLIFALGFEAVAGRMGAMDARRDIQILEYGIQNLAVVWEHIHSNTCKDVVAELVRYSRTQDLEDT